MNIFITGINGFLGSYLAHYFSKKGYNVSGSTSRTITSGNIIHHKMGDEVPENFFNKTDIVIHCAHNFKKYEGETNISGTLRLAEAAQKAGVKKQIYISSLSARPDAISEYGLSKYQTEQILKKNTNIIIIRPGTIIGNGGLFGKMSNTIKKMPLVPLINGGKNLMFLIGIRDLTEIINKMLEPTFEYKNELNIYYRDQISMKDVFLHLKSVLKTKNIFISIPIKLISILFNLIESIKIKLPFNSDNLNGFESSQSMIHSCDIEHFIPNFTLKNELDKTLISNLQL